MCYLSHRYGKEIFPFCSREMIHKKVFAAKEHLTTTGLGRYIYIYILPISFSSVFWLGRVTRGPSSKAASSQRLSECGAWLQGGSVSRLCRKCKSSRIQMYYRFLLEYYFRITTWLCLCIKVCYNSELDTAPNRSMSCVKQL